MRIRSEWLRALSIAALSLGLLGCPSYGLHQGTAPVPEGRYQIAAAAGPVVVNDRPQESRAMVPTLELGLRRGVSRDADVQLKLYTLGVDLGFKYRVLRGDWSMAVLPMLGATRLPETQITTNALYVWGHLTTLLGRRISPDVQLNVGPRLSYGAYVPALGDGAQGLMVGGFGNFELRLQERVRLVPEMSLVGSLGGSVPVRGWALYLGPGVLFDL